MQTLTVDSFKQTLGFSEWPCGPVEHEHTVQPTN